MKQDWLSIREGKEASGWLVLAELPFVALQLYVTCLWARARKEWLGLGCLLDGQSTEGKPCAAGMARPWCYQHIHLFEIKF